MTHHEEQPHADRPAVEPIMRPVEELEAEAHLGPAELMGDSTDGSVDGGDGIVVPFSVGAGQTLSERPLPIVVDSAVDDQVLVDEEEFKITE